MNGTYCRYQCCYWHSRGHHSNHTPGTSGAKAGTLGATSAEARSAGPPQHPQEPPPQASDVRPLWGPLLSCGSRFENLPRLPSLLCPERLGLPAPPCTRVAVAEKQTSRGHPARGFRPCGLPHDVTFLPPFLQINQKRLMAEFQLVPGRHPHRLLSEDRGGGRAGGVPAWPRAG